ncbi:MAG: DUF5009 domain-containing protein [Verrucomicrobiales bacterium]|nr:DUF5009 domain-containing protein [Verrucomicrobiales bacterium]
MPTSPSPSPAPAAAPRRFISVDALRGFDMLWIVGAAGLVRALDKLAGGQDSGVLHFLAQQFQHKDWDGFAFYDLIFPLFVFLVGASVVFSMTRALGQEGKGAAYRRIFKRFILLYIVALIYSGGVSQLWPGIRLMGVLNRIALAYLVTALAFCHLRGRGLATLCATLLLGYWALMTFVPFPDVRPRQPNGELVSTRIETRKVEELNWNSSHTLRGVFEPGLNLANYLDQKYLPGHKHDGTYDPEGLLSTLPAIGTCLLGALAGLLLINPGITDQKKVIILMGAGAVSVALGFLWGLQFPVIKKIWTSSFVLVAGGYSALLLGLFHQVIEVWKIQGWVLPFVWVGSNSITIYLANNLIGFGKLAERFVGGDVSAFMDRTFRPGAGALLSAIVAVGIGLALVRFLYQKRIFLRL